MTCEQAGTRGDSSSTPPRPSRARSSTCSRPTACSSTASSSTRPTAGRFKTINPATEEVLAEVAEAGGRGRRPRGARPRAARTTGSWSQAAGPRARQVPLPHRAHHPGARPRAGGARVARQRQADPRVARRRRAAGRGALLLLRGLGRQARRTPGSARTRRPLGVAGQVIPWNFPLLMLAWKIAPALAVRQHRRAQAGRDDAAHRAAVRRDLPAGRPAAGRRQHRDRRRRHRPRARRARRRRQGRLHRLDRGRQDRSPARPPARTRRSRSSSAARPPTSSSTTRRSTRPSRASSTASSSTRATSAAPARGCWCRRSSYDEVLDVAQAPARHAARRRPAGQEHRHRRDQLRRAAGPDPRALRRRRGRGRRALVAAVRAARPRASGSRRRVFTGVSQAHRIAREEIFGPVLSVLTFRTPAEAVEKANNTPYGLSAGVWTEKGSRILWMADQLRAGVVWANTFNRFDPTSPFGGYKESGYGREGGRHGLEAYLACRSSRRLRRVGTARLDVRKTYKLYVGGKFPRSETGRSYEVTDAKGEFLANAAHGLAQGRPRRGRRRAQGVPRLVGRDGVQPRPGALPRRRDARGPARRSSSTRSPRGEGLAAPQAGAVVDAAIDRWVWYAGLVRQDRPGARLAPTRSPGRTSTSRVPEPTGVVAVSPRRSRRCSGWSRWSRRRSSPATPSSCWPARRARCPRSRWPRCWPPPTCPAAWSTSSPAAPPRSRRGSPRTWTSTRIDLAGVGDATLADLEVAAADNLKRVLRAARRPDWTAEPGHRPDAGLPRDQDGLAPDRRLRPARAASPRRAGAAAWRSRPGRPSRPAPRYLRVSTTAGFAARGSRAPAREHGVEVGRDVDLGHAGSHRGDELVVGHAGRAVQHQRHRHRARGLPRSRSRSSAAVAARSSRASCPPPRRARRRRCRATKAAASSGSVRTPGACTPSLPPISPSSASTQTPRAWQRCDDRAGHRPVGSSSSSATRRT